MDWETNGHHLGYIPLIYMGTIVLWLTIVCSMKHTPFPTSNKLTTSEGDEKETFYAQATKSLRVVRMDIQHGPEVLQRFKATHKPLVKASFNFENMESHGKPIKLILHQLMTWTLPKEGITLLELFGGIGISLEALL